MSVSSCCLDSAATSASEVLELAVDTLNLSVVTVLADSLAGGEGVGADEEADGWEGPGWRQVDAEADAAGAGRQKQWSPARPTRAPCEERAGCPREGA